MRRREFLHGAAGLTAYGLSPVVSARPRALTVGVVGSGIVGACIALHLAQAGANVTLFEKTGPAKGATQNSFGFLNIFDLDKHYQALRLESVLAYRDLDTPFQLGITWGGYIGHVDPVWVTYRFLDAAKSYGAKTLYPCEVYGLDFRHQRLIGITTSQGKFPVDRLIVAAGVDTPQILSMAGFDLRLRHAPGILAHSVPIARILKRIATVLPGARDAILDRLTLGFRPMPIDGFPIVGAIPSARDVYVAVTHSGVTLAPILGRHVSREVLTDSPVDALAPYRPTRFGGASPVGTAGSVVASRALTA
jgi:glycine/D-amino acid oxidase-like deaminating enzyme